MAGQVWRQELEVDGHIDGHIASAARQQRQVFADVQFFLLFI